MGLHVLLCLLLRGLAALAALDFPAGRPLTIPIPSTYEEGFAGRASFLDAGRVKKPPPFKAALSVEAADGSYSCSLLVLLGDLKVWASDHGSPRFVPARRCVLELAPTGDLRLMDWRGRVGWRTGTCGQGVERLRLDKKTGNLILTNRENQTVWQSFDFPANIMLWGQQLDASTTLTSFPTAASPESYSFQVGNEKLVAYFHSGGHKYWYWELRPLRNTSIAFARLGSKGLKFFDASTRKIGQILAASSEPVRFLALERNGSLGLHYYYSDKGQDSYQALHRFCDLPLPCGYYGICVSPSTCTYMELPGKPEFYSNFCSRGDSGIEMVEVQGADSVLKTTFPKTNLSKEECVSSCREDCSCAAAQYSNGAGECHRYGLVGGVREVGRGECQYSYWVKVAKGTQGNHGVTPGLMTKLLIVVGVLDGLAVLMILGGLLYYFIKIRKRTENLGIDNT